jgi:hypothetical protein
MGLRQSLLLCEHNCCGKVCRLDFKNREIGLNAHLNLKFAMMSTWTIFKSSLIIFEPYFLVIYYERGKLKHLNLYIQYNFRSNLARSPGEALAQREASFDSPESHDGLLWRTSPVHSSKFVVQRALQKIGCKWVDIMRRSGMKSTP